eukprot:7462229-Pyramimonas_sp.AAC.1
MLAVATSTEGQDYVPKNIAAKALEIQQALELCGNALDHSSTGDAPDKETVLKFVGEVNEALD